MTQCVCCDSAAVSVETAEVGKSGNWIRGPFCSDHIKPARQYGRVAKHPKSYHDGKRVEKPEWAEDWQYQAPGQPPENNDEPETAIDSDLSDKNYNELKQMAAERGLDVGMTPEKDTLIQQLSNANE